MGIFNEERLDGWIEQGGKYTKQSNAETYCSFNKSMNTVCTITIGTTKSGNNSGYGGMMIYNYTSSGFTTKTNTGEVTGAFWFACGL